MLLDVRLPGAGRSVAPRDGSPVSYTHLDVYKRQALESNRLNVAAGSPAAQFYETLLRVTDPNEAANMIQSVSGENVMKMCIRDRTLTTCCSTS